MRLGVAISLGVGGLVPPDLGSVSATDPEDTAVVSMLETITSTIGASDPGDTAAMSILETITSTIGATDPGDTMSASLTEADPTVTAISPTIGDFAGGVAVTITGTGFLTGDSVTIGGVSCTGVSVVNGTTLTATTAADTGSTTAKDVVVTRANGQTGTGSALYRVFDPRVVASATCVLWLDSRVGNGITQSGNITAWTDRSSSHHDTVSVASNNPAYNSSNSNWNNLPSCDFATTKRFNLPDLGFTTGDISWVYMGYQGNPNADFFGTIEATPKARCFNLATNQYLFTRDGVSGHGIASGNLDTSKQIMVWTTSGTTQKLYKSAKTPSSNSVNVQTDLTGKTWMVGNFGGGVNSLFTQGGPFVGMLAFNGTLSAADAGYLLDGFGQIYNVSIGA